MLSKQAGCHRETWLDAILTALWHGRLTAASLPRWEKPCTADVNYRICRLALGPIRALADWNISVQAAVRW
jgi:hypothetical protein